MSTSIDKTTAVSIPAHARRSYQRNAPWSVSIPGTNVYGGGATLTAARDDAGAQVAAILANVGELPAAVRDGDGSLWLFSPWPGGHFAKRIRPDGTASGCSTSGDGSPSSAADTLVRHHAGAVRVF